MAVGGMGRGFGSDRSNKNKFLVGEVMGELVVCGVVGILRKTGENGLER
jgi:hypothetical protein